MNNPITENNNQAPGGAQNTQGNQQGRGNTMPPMTISRSVSSGVIQDSISRAIDSQLNAAPGETTTGTQGSTGSNVHPASVETLKEIEKHNEVETATTSTTATTDVNSDTFSMEEQIKAMLEEYSGTKIEPLTEKKEEPVTDSDLKLDGLSPEGKAYLETPEAKRVYGNHKGFRELQVLAREHIGRDLNTQELATYLSSGISDEMMIQDFVGANGPDGQMRWIQNYFGASKEGNVHPASVEVLTKIPEIGLANPETRQAFIQPVLEALPNYLVEYAKQFGQGTDNYQAVIHAARTLDQIYKMGGVGAKPDPQFVETSKETENTGASNPDLVRLQQENEELKRKLNQTSNIDRENKYREAVKTIQHQVTGVHISKALEMFDKAIGVPQGDTAAGTFFNAAKKVFFDQLTSDIKRDPIANEIIATVKQHTSGGVIRLTNLQASQLSQQFDALVKKYAASRLSTDAIGIRNRVHINAAPVKANSTANLTMAANSGDNTKQATASTSLAAEGSKGTLPQNPVVDNKPAVLESRGKTKHELFKSVVEASLNKVFQQ